MEGLVGRKESGEKRISVRGCPLYVCVYSRNGNAVLTLMQCFLSQVTVQNTPLTKVPIHDAGILAIRAHLYCTVIYKNFVGSLQELISGSNEENRTTIAHKRI